MRITIIGAGPAGLYAAYLFKMRMPRAEVTVLERRPRDQRPGLGITLPAYAVALAMEGDPDSPLFSQLTPPWNHAQIHVNGESFTFPFAALAGVARAALVGYLEDRCQALGANVRFGVPVAADQVAVVAAECDLLVAADGAGSAVRGHCAEALGAVVEEGCNHYIWLAADRAFAEMRIGFQETESGVVMCAAYPYSSERSTAIVECGPSTWQSLQLDRHQSAERVIDSAGRVRLEGFFGSLLQGARLLGNARWRHFRRVTTSRLTVGNIALVGDAGATMYYSFGAGTPMALRCAAELVERVTTQPDRRLALAQYENACRPVLAATQRAADIDMRAMQKLDTLSAIHPASFARAYVRRFDR